MRMRQWMAIWLCVSVAACALAGCGSTESPQTNLTVKPAVATTTTANISTTTTTSTTISTTLPPVVIDPEAAKAALDDILTRAADTYGAVGIQVAVLAGGEVLHTGQYGWAQKEEVPVSVDTMYRVASLTKTVVSMIAHRLIDDGLLSLEDDISDYLGVTVRHPDYPDIPITVRMLLCHTSALAETDIDALSNPVKWRKHLTSDKAFTENKPGTTYEYNNFAFSVLGTVCEYAAGSNITDMAENYFFKPMGIRATFMRGRVPVKNFGILYTSDGKEGQGMRPNQGKDGYFKTPGSSMFCFPGNLFISASDYARLLWVLMNDGVYEDKTLLSMDAVASIQEVQYQRGDNLGQCLPVWRKDGMYGQATLYCHTGNTHGMYSMYVYNPDTGVAVVVCTSGANGVQKGDDIFCVCDDIIRSIFLKSDVFFGRPQN